MAVECRNDKADCAHNLAIEKVRLYFLNLIKDARKWLVLTRKMGTWRRKFLPSHSDSFALDAKNTTTKDKHDRDGEQAIMLNTLFFFSCSASHYFTLGRRVSDSARKAPR